MNKVTITTKSVKIKTKRGKLTFDKKHTVTSIQPHFDAIIAKEPLFSHLIHRLAPIESVTIPTSATDGTNIFWNRKFFEAISFEEGCGVLLHEVLHNAFLHLWRREKRDPQLWNIATDYAINLVVNQTFSLPPGTLLDEKYKNMSAEEIYDLLPVEKKTQQGWCEKPWDGTGKGQKQQPGQSSGNIVSKLAQGMRDAATKAKEDAAKAKAAGKSDQQTQREWERAFDEAFTKHYGSAPEYIKRLVAAKHYIPVIDWASLVANILSEDISDYTFSSPDRRFLEEPFILPELYSWDKVKDVVFAYDTSGSISDDDLHAFYNETKAMFEQFETLDGWAGVCDAYLHSFKELSRDATYKDINFKGGGGTAFEPVFAEVAKRELRPKALFYFTDTYGSFPREEPPYPVFWLVRSHIGDNNNYENVPWGTIIKFMNAKDMKRYT